jgi:hypothetical protein
MAHVNRPTENHKKHVDDLKRIRGIGPAMEQRLNRNGVFTFAKFAHLSTEDLATILVGIPGISKERIAESGWSNQAQLMIEKEDVIDKPITEDSSQHSALFSVDLLVDNQNRVRRTHILHVQSLKENSWAGWNPDQLTGFILENASTRSNQTLTEKIEKKLGLESLREEEKKSETKGKQGGINITEVKIQSKLGKNTHWSIAVHESFAVGLILDLSKTTVTPGTPLQYQAEIHAKNLAYGTRKKIGSNMGIIESRNLFPLVVNCSELPEGSYRLEACVILSSNLEDQNPKSHLLAITEGKVFRVG